MAWRYFLRRWIRFVLAALVAFLCLGTSVAAETVYVGDYLQRVGVIHDCYFTVEEGGPHDWRFLRSKVTWPEQSLSLADYLRLIQNKDNRLDVLQDPVAPCVTHLVAASLADCKDYELNKRFGTFGFAGDPSLLLWKLKRNGANVVGSFASSEALIGIDNETILDIPLQKGLAVRDIMSRFLPLARYDRLMWTSQRLLVDPAGSSVLFYLRKPMEGVTKICTAIDNMPMGETVHDAYVSRREKDLAPVLGFLSQRAMTSDRSSQVRWAIRILGDLEAQDSIHLLVQWLSYEYSPYPVVEERFPAVYALTKIGMPSVSFITHISLPNESDPLRRRLMCYVLQAVEGRNLTRRLIREASEIAESPAQKSNLAEALKICESDEIVIPSKTSDDPARAVKNQ